LGYFPTEVKPEGHSAHLKRVKLSAAKASGLGDGGRLPHAGPQADEPLGNNTKSQAALEVREGQNPESIQLFTLDNARREYVQVVTRETALVVARQARYSAQSSATKLLFRSQTPRDSQWRVTGCARRKISDTVAVLHSSKLSRAHYGNLMICGSVWTCSVCAAKISEARKREIRAATDLHIAGGGWMYMVTYTFSHQRNDNINDLLVRLKKARTWLREQRAYKALRRELGCLGDIRALEVTYGAKNGWHPHEHGLWLVGTRFTRDQLRKITSTLFTLWLAACARAGLGAPNRKRGVNVIECQSAADYMAKMGREQTWGVSSELAKQHIKSGRGDSMTPMDLLRSYEIGNKHHGALFVQYAEAFYGKRQIIWSKGLKALFGIEQREDQELAEEELSDDSVEILKITAVEWRAVLSMRYDVRAQVLLAAEAGGYDAARLYLDHVVIRSGG
jgi:hypothetical protein